MATAIELVRTLIPDNDDIFGDAEDEYLFDDEQINNFLTLGGNNPYWAAGLAMVAIGNSEALINKVIINQDLATDGSKVQAGYLKSGAYYISLGQQQANDALWSGFEIVEFQTDSWRPELTEGVYPNYLQW